MPYNDILAMLKDAIHYVSDNIQNYVVRPNSDFTQNGKLTPEKLMTFLIGQGAKSTRNELIEAFDGDREHPSAPALVQKRAKLLPSAFSEVLYRFNKSLEAPSVPSVPSVPSTPATSSTPSAHSSGSDYRFYAADGSTLTFLSDPRFASDEYYTTQGNSEAGCYSVHMTAFLDLDSNRYTDAIIQPITQKDEYSAFSAIIDRHPLPNNARAVFIADRGFCSYNNMAHVLQRGQFFLFRAKDIHSKGLLHRIVFPSDEAFDITVRLVIVRRQSKGRSLPEGYVRYVGKNTSFDFLEYGSDACYELPLRVVRFQLSSGEYESLVTNLPADDFSSDQLKELYFRRWGIETSFRTLKYTIGLTKFHARKPAFIIQEIWARLISYNFTSAVADCVEVPVGQNKYTYKISVSTAVLACRKYILSLIAGIPWDIMGVLSRELVPVRANRSFPRLTTAHFRRPAYFLYRPS